MPNNSDYNNFSMNPTNIDISRSLFNMDHGIKFSCNVGEVIPFDCIEVLPGDTFTIDTSKVIRLQPLVAPIMDEVILDTYWFFVPNRLVWSHWKEFMGENNSSAWTPAVEYNIPQVSAPVFNPEGSEGVHPYAWETGTIADYMGLPVGEIGNTDMNVGSEAKFSALPLRAYALICDQWFKSESVMDPVHVFVDDSNRTGSNGSDQVTDIELGGKPFIACKYFDYFTSCLPQPQRGDAVSLTPFSEGYKWYPVTNRAVSYNHPYKAGNSTDDPTVHLTYRSNTTSESTLGTITGNHLLGTLGSNLRSQTDTASNLASNHIYFDNLWVGITNNSFNGLTVNDLRTAFAIQKYLEKQARFGGRYIEYIKAFFNVDSPDARLQRTEYLGGNRLTLNINSVEQTSATTSDTTPLGNVAGMSVTGDSHSDFTKSFTEHGFIIGCSVVRYHHSYQDATHRMWFRKTPYEFYNPVFANLGEQPVGAKEIYAYDIFNGDQTFGYNEAWAEYRYQPSRVAGEMRSVYKTPLDMWHLGDHYTDTPVLSPEWLREDKSNLDRCLAVTSEVSNQVICDFFIKTEAARPMPLYSIPGLIDHH